MGAEMWLLDRSRAMEWIERKYGAEVKFAVEVSGADPVKFVDAAQDYEKTRRERLKAAASAGEVYDDGEEDD